MTVSSESTQITQNWQPLIVTVESPLSHTAFRLTTLCRIEEGPTWQWRPPAPRQGVEDRVTRGPLCPAPGDQVREGRSVPSPTHGTSVRVTAPLALCPWGHSPDSGPGPTAHAFLLVPQPGPSAAPESWLCPWSRPPWTFARDACTWFPTCDPALRPSPQSIRLNCLSLCTDDKSEIQDISPEPQSWARIEPGPNPAPSNSTPASPP